MNGSFVRRKWFVDSSAFRNSWSGTLTLVGALMAVLVASTGVSSGVLLVAVGPFVVRAIGLPLTSVAGGAGVVMMTVLASRLAQIRWAWGVPLLGLTLFAPASARTLSTPWALTWAFLSGMAVSGAIVAGARFFERTRAPHTGLVRSLMLSAMGHAAGLGLAVGLLSRLGFEGLALLAGALAAAVTASVAAAFRMRQAPRPSRVEVRETLRVVGLGAAFGAGALLLQSMLVPVAGDPMLSRPLWASASLFVVVLALWRSQTRSSAEPVSLAQRQGPQIRLGLVAGAIVVLSAPLLPRVTSVFAFVTELLRPVPAAWPVKIILTWFAMTAVVAPIAWSFGLAVGESASAWGRSVGTSERWLTAFAFGGGGGWTVALAAAGAVSMEPIWAGVSLMCVAASSPSWRWTLGLVAVVLGVFASTRGWAPALMARGEASDWARQTPQQGELVRFDVSGFETFAVFRRPDGESVLRVDGHREVGTGRFSAEAVIGVHAGVLFAPAPIRRALVVGWAPGIVEALAAHELTQIDVVAPSRVLDAMSSPVGAARLIDEDPRAFLERTKETWDAVVFANGRPGRGLARDLFTVETWNLAKKHLSPHGVMTQRVTLAETNSAMLASVAASLRTVFGYGTTWGGADEVTFVMSEQPQDAGEDRWPKGPARQALHGLEVAEVSALWAMQVHSDAGQAQLAFGGQPSTDGHPRAALMAPFAWFVRAPAELMDERFLSGPTELELSRRSHEKPLSAQAFTAIHHTLSRFWNPASPLVRSAAEHRRLADETSVEAAKEASAAALAQGDLFGAQRAVEPFLASPTPPPEILAAALEVLRAQAEAWSAPFAPITHEALVEQAKGVLLQHPEAVALRQALERWERLR